MAQETGDENDGDEDDDDDGDNSENNSRSKIHYLFEVFLTLNSNYTEKITKICTRKKIQYSLHRCRLSRQSEKSQALPGPYKFRKNENSLSRPSITLFEITTF